MAVDPVMYIFLNKGLEMSVGKAAAQAGHAAVEGYRLTPESSNLVRLWYRGGGYKKVVLEARDEGHLHTIEKYLRERDIACVPIIDEGHTEVPPHSFTAIGCELVDKSDPHVAATFEGFALYKSTEAERWIRTIPKLSPAEPQQWEFTKSGVVVIEAAAAGAPPGTLRLSDGSLYYTGFPEEKMSGSPGKPENMNMRSSLPDRGKNWWQLGR